MSFVQLALYSLTIEERGGSVATLVDRGDTLISSIRIELMPQSMRYCIA